MATYLYCSVCDEIWIDLNRSFGKHRNYLKFSKTVRLRVKSMICPECMEKDPIPRHYQKREFCKAMGCPRLINIDEEIKVEGTSETVKVKELCKSDCIHNAWKLHDWLQKNHFQLVKYEEKKEKGENE